MLRDTRETTTLLLSYSRQMPAKASRSRRQQVGEVRGLGLGRKRLQVHPAVPEE